MAPLNVRQAATWLSGSSAMSLTPVAHSFHPGLLPPTQQGFAEPLLWWSPSTNLARICWATATVTQQRCAESDSLHDIYTQQGNSVCNDWVSSTSSARICWASPDNYSLYIQHKDTAEKVWVWLTTIQLMNSAEEYDWVWFSTHTQLRDSAKKMTESGSPHRRLRDSAKKMAESGSPHRRYQDPGVEQDCVWLHNGIDTEKRKQLTRFLSAWILVSLWVTCQRSHLLWFHLQLLILLCGASSHIEFLLAGRKAVLMTFAIATRYTSGPLTQPFLVY